VRPRLGFIGIGLMGEGMVRRLLERGWHVTAWNLEPERLATVVPHGAVAAASPAAVAAASDIVLMCVLDTAAVRRCVEAEDGVVAGTPAPRLVIDLSTIDPEATRELAAAVAARGMAWVDAPVSGGPAAARAGSLAIMAGGTDAAIETARPVLVDLAASLTPMGPAGAGQTAKMVNQALVAAGFLAMAEAVALAEAAGLPVDRIPACLAGGAADSRLLQTVFPQMHERAFDPPRAYARQLLKDIKAVDAFAAGLGLELPVVRVALERYTAFVAAGNAMTDPAAIAVGYGRRG
jgi:3-hydroxyisobutyrate dehydrogenase